MPYTMLFFDLDDTLYPRDCGLWPAIYERISLYMHERVGLPWELIPPLRKRLFQQYGTTMRGLVVEYGIDEQDYLAFVHDLPLQNFIQPDPAIRAMLKRYSQPKAIFTNADRNHARRVLRMLDLEDSFDFIIDILDMSPYCKPMPEAFGIALHKTGNPDPVNCVLIDDMPANLATARWLGFYTIRVGDVTPGSQYHTAILKLSDLPSILDNLLDGKSSSVHLALQQE